MSVIMHMCVQPTVLKLGWSTVLVLTYSSCDGVPLFFQSNLVYTNQPPPFLTEFINEKDTCLLHWKDSGFINQGSR